MKMATLRSRATDISQYRGATMHTRRLQEGLYTHLDQQERAAFIEVLNTYGVRKDIFELVNSLRKILNTPVKRQLFPLVRGVIRKSDMEAFDLLTRGGKNYGTLPRPFLYRPHAADISVLRKHRSHTLSRYNEISHKRKASSLVSDFSDREEPPVLSGQNVQTIFIETRDKNYDGFGFNIRGGSEYGLGVYVSSVDEGGPAEIQGLQVGDLVLEANDISFQNISHGEAARMIRAASRLELTICRVGRVPGTHTVHEAYKWVDARGRPVSPPPDLVTSGNTNDDADIRSRSSLNLLKGSDERKVNVVVDSGHSLGLTIRGGRDYGLGVYVSGVDPYSVAENAGLKVGDQLLDANGQSMAALSHAEAVRVLTRCRHMVLTVKDVGRVPYAKTTIDRTHWVNKDSSDALQNGGGRGRFWGRKSVSEPDLMNVGFSRGAGSQLMLSAMSTRSQYDIVEDQARVLLNTEEQATLRYYLAEYTREVIRVPGLAFALAELFNTGAKLTLMSEIRPLIQARDLDTFDRLVNRPDIQTGLQGGAVRSLDNDSYSLMSGDSADAFIDDHNKRTLFSTKIKPVMQPRTMDALTINIPTTSITTATTTTTTTRHRAKSEKDVPSYSTSVDRWDSITATTSENGTVSKHEKHESHVPKLTKPIPFARGQAVRRQKPHSRQSRPRSPVATLMHVASPNSGAASAVLSDVGGSSGFGGGAAASTTASKVTYTKADVHHRGKGILKRWRSKVKAALSPNRVRFSGHMTDRVITYNSEPESSDDEDQLDDPSDDSGVEVSNPHPLDPRAFLGVEVSNAHPLDPRAFLGVDGGRFNPNRHSKRVTISKAGPVEIENGEGRLPSDSHLMVPFPGHPSTSASGSSPRVSPRSHEEQRRQEGREKYGDIPLGVVYIYRCKPTLGVAIEGGANTRQPLPRVVTVQPGGSAFESGGLRVGHVILEVNGIPLAGRGHTEVARLIAETFKDKEEERMELLVTDSSQSVMDELRQRLSELAIEK